MSVIGPASSVGWGRIEASGFACVDGRHATAHMYAYGGDLGEFVLALSVLEHVSDRQIGQAETTRLFEGWIKLLGENGGRFFSCIDASAIAQLALAVGQPAECVVLHML